MRMNNYKAILKAALRALCILPLAAVVAFCQQPQQVNLTAAPMDTTLPDGTMVPMWGYSCGTAVTGSTAACAKLNPAAIGWSPVVITIPTGVSLQVNLTNYISPANAPVVPTSLIIIGQLGGGLGDATQRTTTPSPDHSYAQGQVTWPIAGNPGVVLPKQGDRVQSFATEVGAGGTLPLCWGPDCSVVTPALRPGTYLIESGTHPSIQVPMGLYGMLVVTSAPTAAAAGTAYPGVNYNTDVPLLLSEIDPVQNNAVNMAVNTPGFSETAVWSGQPGGCGNPTSTTYLTCYPPAVNYTPMYYLFNGIAFDKTKPLVSLFPASIGTAIAPVTGSVLVRFVNAGSRMHVPSIVGSLTGTPPVSGFSLIAEDGNPLPGTPRVQSEVFMAAGKTYDVMVNVPAAGATALPVYDRELSLSGNATSRDAGMLAYISVNGAGLQAAPAFANAKANPDTYNSVVPGQTLTVSDPAKGVIANDINVYGVSLLGTGPANGALTLNSNGTFTYVPNNTWTTSTTDTFVYYANNNPAIFATVTLGAAPIEDGSGIICTASTYTSTVATILKISPPGILAGCTDAKGYPLTVNPASVSGFTGLSVDANGGFNAVVTAPGTYTFTFKAQNSQGTVSSSAATTVTLNFPTPSNLAVTVMDGADKKTKITDYRWTIEEDLTFFVDPNCTMNPLPAGCPTVTPQGAPAVFGTNFHTSHMPLVATGCTGPLSCEGGQTVQGQAVVCDQGNGVCRPDTTGNGQIWVDPSQVHLDPTKRYYLSVLPGDAAQPFIAGYLGAPVCSSTTAGVSTPNTTCGHGMGGAPIAKAQTSVTVLTQPSPYPPAKLSVFVFEDDYPLNGEHNAGGGIDVLSPQEPGLGGFQITLDDSAGGTGDPTGTPTYDMFNQPLTNSLAGTIDPATGNDACPIGKSRTGMIPNPAWTLTNGQPKMIPDPNQAGITGMIVTCPKYESDGKTLSPMAGQAVVSNLYPGRYGVIANPGADRIAQGEEWLQTNTLDGQKAHDSFMRIGEPGYFQEFGPGGYHVTIGFANPKIINDRRAGMCTATTPCNNEVKGHVTTARMSRTPDERLYGSGSHDAFAFTQCYASIGDPDGADFAFVKCDKDGNFDFTGIPAGNFKLTLFDQWNDQVVDGISTPVGLAGKSGTVLDMGEIAAHQWQANFFSRTFLDENGDGVSQTNEPGLALVKTNVRFRDGSFSNRNTTDLNGYAPFNEEFPLFNWYVIETDVTRYKNTGTHVVYDAGGPTDGTPGGGTSAIAAHFGNTVEAVPVPTNLRVPGAVYCDNADCTGLSIASGPEAGGNSGPGGSTGRIDPPWVLTEGWQGYSGQNNFLEFGKRPYVPGENGGIRGHVVYSSTRPFDDPQFGTQNVWEPLVPGVTINLYQEGTAPDGTTSLTLVDTTQTSSFDKWAQGFRSDGVPNMNCPGQSTTDPFFLGLENQPNYLDWYNSQHGGPAVTALPANSQFKCYDGMHNWNQLQPAPYDGMYQFPSVTGMDPVTGKPTGTHCTICVSNPDGTDPYRFGLPMLPKGKYVVEVVVPPGYELVKEEDKNILIGDNFIAPVTVQFPSLGSAIFIIPDQAAVGATYNANSTVNPTQSLGRIQNLVSHEGDTATMSTFWPCVGATRIVPDFISLFPLSREVAPFAGASRNLCDRKEVALDDQTSQQAEFFIWTPTHIASKFTGIITDDFDAEFDPFSPQFGEKFAPAYLPVSIKDWAGNEISRMYSDEWGAYNGLSYSTWEVNPPNPTGYAPTMMVTCMNDPGTGTTPDPLFQPGYSQFCYELPFMPGNTGYFDTPVVPTSAFAGGYNHPDCAYPDATPAISEVDGDGVGPWVSAPGKTLTIKYLGDQSVENSGYSGPGATTSPYNQQKVTRHYGFGSQCTAPLIGACTAISSVTIGTDATGKPIPATITSWSDTAITVTVPSGVQPCAVQQQAQYGGSPAQCGQLVITAGNGKQSIDAVTVTVGGKAPTVLAAGQTVQSVIDAAQPGDMIILPPGNYSEMLIMWKPLRLQGVGAASTVIDANPHPAGRLDPWRRQIVCLFGLALNGTPIAGPSTTNPKGNPYDSTGNFSCNSSMQFSVDRLPLEATVGWTALLNGNLAEQLIEPSLMGAYEGAGITVLAKGVKFPTSDPAVIWASDVYPSGTELLKPADCNTGTQTSPNNPYPSNFWCNPSRIDGLSVINSSQGGGGILVHGWGHNLEIANNRVHSNQGTLSGGITVGQGEHPDVSLAGQAPTTIPGSCESDPLGTLEPGQVPNQALAYCFDMYVSIHNNAVTLNSSLGDELFSSTPAGAGGVTMCNGSDYYKFSYNWVCGNMSTGDGAGVAHLGFTKNGDIEHNSILFNQSTNPSITTNGGGLLVMGAPDQDPPCGLTTDKDCLSAPNTITPSDGTGPGLVINANLIMGNSADSGSGGGLRLQHINGNDVINFPNGAVDCNNPGSPTCLWNSVSVTNNIITNNVAGWDGGGVSLQDALAVNIVNNTIVSNDSTASAGPLFGSLFAPLASTPVTGTSGVNCSTTALEQSCPQIAGLASVTNSPVLVANLPTSGITCPQGHGTSGSCGKYSVPLLANNVIWQNRSYVVGVGGLGTGTTSQQKVIALYNSAFNGTSATTLAASQTATGACPTPASYWDIGVRGDTGPANHDGGLLSPTSSVLTDAADYPGANNLATDPALVRPYCNGSRVPPELGSMGYMVTPGTNEVNALPTPVFSLTTSATVDEGNNWVNLRWGPLAMTNPATGATLGDYTLSAGSPAVDAINSSAPTYALAPPTDFFGNPRADLAGTAIDIGAVETPKSLGPGASVTPTSLAFGNQMVNTTSGPMSVVVSSVGEVPLTINSITATGDFAISNIACGQPPQTLTTPATCSISVTFTPSAMGARTGSLIINSNDKTSPLTVGLTGTGIEPLISASPTSLPFGTQRVRSASGNQVVTITSSGNLPLIISGVGNNNTAEFNVTNTCGQLPSTLSPGASCSISATFTPQARGARSATVTINSNALNSPTLQIMLTGTGVAPVVNSTPTALSFSPPVVPLSTTAGPQTATLSNTTTDAGQNLIVSSLTMSGPNSSEFAIAAGSCAIGATGVAPGGSCPINVTFRPTGAGSRSATLTIATNDPLTPTITISLTGTGTAVSLNPTSLTFAPQLVGTNSTTQLVTVTNLNAGTTRLIITGVSITGDFARLGGNCVTGGPGLVAGANCTLAVTFHPTATGARSGNLAISTNDPGTPTVNVPLSGTGIQGDATFNPNPVTFTNVVVNTTSTINVIVTNSGTAPLTIGSDSVSGFRFSRVAVSDTCANQVIPVSGTCTIPVSFNPNNNTPRTGTLTLYDNGAGGSQSVNLSGTGVQGIVSANPTSVAFGTVHAGSPTSQTVTVTNSGNGALTFTTDTVTGSTNFTKGVAAGNDTCAGQTILPNGTCTIVVNFTPTVNSPTTGSTSRTGSLTIHSNGTVASYVVNLSGTVVQAVAAMSAPVGNLNTGGLGIKNATITVTNNGASPLTMTAAPQIVKDSGPGVFTLTTAGTTPCTATTVLAASGGSCTIGVQYNPNGSTLSSSAHVVLTDSGAAATTQNGASFNANSLPPARQSRVRSTPVRRGN
jgi:hypothetical protein